MSKFYWDDDVDELADDEDDFPPEEEDEDNPNAYRWAEPEDEWEAADEEDYDDPQCESALDAYYRSPPETRPSAHSSTAARSDTRSTQGAARPERPIAERKAIGFAFEQWVADQFPAESFEIVKWQGDKETTDGRRARESQNPDFEFELRKHPNRKIARGMQVAVRIRRRPFYMG